MFATFVRSRSNARAIEKTGRKNGADGPTRVIVTDRAPSHRMSYVDQLLGDFPQGYHTEGVEYEFRGNPLVASEIDVIYLTTPRSAIGDRSVPERMRVRRAKQFARNLKRRRIALVRPLRLGDDSTASLTPPAAEAILHEATAVYICDTPIQVTPHNRPAVVIPHSHLESRYLGYPRGAVVPGRILLVSTSSFTSGSERALKVFALADLPDYALRLVGQVPESRRSSYMRTLTQESQRTSLRDARLSDAARVEEISSAELVVIPDPDTRDSQTLILLALSLGRPVLVQATPGTDRLAVEVGVGWVRRHEGPLTATSLECALGQLRNTPPNGYPDLAAREPSVIAAQYADAFRIAAESQRRPA